MASGFPPRPYNTALGSRAAANTNPAQQSQYGVPPSGLAGGPSGGPINPYGAGSNSNPYVNTFGGGQQQGQPGQQQSQQQQASQQQREAARLERERIERAERERREAEGREVLEALSEEQREEINEAVSIAFHFPISHFFNQSYWYKLYFILYTSYYNRKD